MKKLLFLLLVFLCWPVLATQPHEKQYEEIDCAEDTDLSTAQSLTDFSSFTAAEVEQATRVFMMADGGAIRWRPDATNPTDSVGFVMRDGTDTGSPMFFSGTVGDLRFKAADSTADLFVCLYK